MPRTNDAAVKAILNRDYDTRNNPSLSGYMESADAIVDDVVSCASQKSVTIDTTRAELLARWITAHMYCLSDRLYMSRSTAGASGSFSVPTGLGLESTPYGQMALRLDPSGCLENIDKNQTASALWLGKTPSESIPYNQRD